METSPTYRAEHAGHWVEVFQSDETWKIRANFDLTPIGLHGYWHPRLDTAKRDAGSALRWFSRGKLRRVIWIQVPAE